MQNSYAHAHTRSQASSMQAKTLPSTHSFRHEWCMATSWSNSPHVRHAGTFALHTQTCRRWLETSVLHSSPLRCYLALGYRDDTHTPNYGGEQLTRCYLLFRSLQCMLHKLKRRFETLLGTWLLFAQSVGMFVQKVQYNLGSIG